MNEGVESFLDHHGVKGQRWGFRNTNKTVSRRAKKVAAFIGKHKEGLGTAAAGAAFVGTILVDKNLRSNHATKSIAAGASWAQTHQEEFSKAKTFSQMLNS